MAEMLKSTMEALQNSATVKSVFGEAISAHGKTIIPVARIAYGFGGGSGSGNSEGHPGQGEGGGGGIVARPSGVFEITPAETRFVPLHENRKLLFALCLGLTVGALWAKRRHCCAG